MHKPGFQSLLLLAIHTKTMSDTSDEAEKMKPKFVLASWLKPLSEISMVYSEGNWMMAVGQEVRQTPFV